MLKDLLTLLFISITSLLSAQTSVEKELEILETPEQIESFLKVKNSKKNKLITFNEEKHKTTLAKDLFKLPKGGMKNVETEFNQTFYKVVEKTEATYYRVSYVALDGSKMTDTEMNTIRTKIIQKYKDGASFDFLAQQYSNDDNANKGGDSGWFTKNENNHAFEETIINDTHDLDDIFRIEIPSTNTYYVVLKTFEPKSISEIKVLKIVENKD
tara:strand:- start:4633 stop:5271 length:639 start_codon:yes stop_codon:yes gene_type:complete